VYALVKLRAEMGHPLLSGKVDWRGVAWGTMLTLGGILAFQMVYSRADAVLIGWIEGNHALGLYTAAYSLMAGLQIVSWMIGIALVPVFARAHGTDRALFQRAWEQGVRAILVIALPLALIPSLLATPIMKLLFGADFAGAGDALAILVWCAPLTGMAILMTGALRGSGQERFLLLIGIVATIVNLGLNVWLIPIYGIDAAAVMTVVTEVVIVAGFAWIGRAKGILGFPRLPYLRIGAAAVALAAVAVLLRGLPVVIPAVVSLLAYLGVGAALGIITRDELAMLRPGRRSG
jgi:O-antigen/teichoic acid export membrane protein